MSAYETVSKRDVARAEMAAESLSMAIYNAEDCPGLEEETRWMEKVLKHIKEWIEWNK